MLPPRKRGRTLLEACLLIATLLFGFAASAQSSVHLIYPSSSETASTTTPQVVLQQGTAGTSTIYDSGVRADVSVDPGEGGGGGLSGWDNRVKLSIDHNDIDEDLSNFPVLCYLSTSSGRGSDDVSFIFDELQSDANRKKIAITKNDHATQCYVEIEKWDDANEQAWLWVKAPFINSTENTDLYLYYDADHADNTDYVGDVNSAVAENVWDDNFQAIYHLSDDIDPTPTIDIGGGAEGTPSGTPTDRSNNFAYFDENNPANADGILKSLKVNIDTVGNGNLYVMTCSKSDNTFTVRDWELVTVQGTGIQVFSVNLDVQTGDYLGFWYQAYTISIERESSTPQYYYAIDNNAPSVGREYSSTKGSNSLRLMTYASSNTAFTVIDSTSNDNDGIPNNMDSDYQVDGNIDGSLDFDGNDDSIDMGSNLSFTAGTHFTIEGWGWVDTKPSGLNWEFLFGNRDGDSAGYWLELDGSGITSLITCDGSYNKASFSSSDFGEDTWQYFVGVFDGSSSRIYLNATLKDTDTGAGYNTPNTNYLLGVNPVDSHFFDGLLDEVRVSNDDRSAAWIKASYETGRDALLDFVSEGEVDYVDNNTSNEGSPSDLGTHSNFTAQQYGPDSIYDTLTELGETDITITTNWGADVEDNGIKYPNDGSDYVGHSGTVPFRTANKFPLTDLPSGSTVTKVEVIFEVSQAGSSLHLLDIHPYNGSGQADPETDSGSNMYTRCASGTEYVNDDTSCRATGVKTIDLGSQACTDVMNAKSAVDRFSLGWHEEGDNSNEAQLAEYTDATNPPKLRITYVDNCELDLEVQWTGADYDEENEYLCIYGGTMGAENLQVDAWTGSAWTTIITDLTADSWNNVSVSSYLTSATFTIRFKGTTEASDTTQDSWNIDATLLNTWTSEATETFDHVLKVFNQVGDNWQINLQCYNTDNLARISSMTIRFHDGTASDQIIVTDGTLTQSEGSTYDLAGSATIYISITNLQTSGSGTTNVYTKLRILKPSTGLYLLYTIDFEVT